MAADADAPSEKLTEAKARVRSLDERHVAAQLAASPADDTFTPDAPVDEDPRMRELVAAPISPQSSRPCARNSGTTGKERELQTELKMQANQIPLVMLADPLVSDAGDGDGARMRTTGQSSAPGEVGQRQTSIIPAVFPAGFRGLPANPAAGRADGQAGFIRRSPPAPVRARRRLVPSRPTARPRSPPLCWNRSESQPEIFYRREDAAVLAGMNAALVANLRSALSDELDQYVLQGATVGLLTGTNLDSHNASSADDYASYLKRFCFDAVDGISANRTADLRLVVGTGTFGEHGLGVQRQCESQSGARRTRTHHRRRARVGQRACGGQQQAERPRPRRRTSPGCRRAIWDGIEVETDRFTQAKSGEIRLNAVMLAQFQVLRKSGFRKVQAQTA